MANKIHTVVLKAEGRSNVKSGSPLIFRRTIKEDEKGKYALINGMKAYLKPREGNGFYIDYFMEKSK